MKLQELKKLRNEIFIWAKIELNKQIVFNVDARMNILVNMRGLKHTLKGKSYNKIELIEKNEAVIMSVKNLIPFLENSKYVGFEPDKRKRDNILGFHIFTDIYIYKNTKYQVKILVKETTDKIYFYDQALIEKNPTTRHSRVSG